MGLDIDDPGFSFRQHGGFRQTSPTSLDYNCIAWAAGFDDAWWWPDIVGIGFWPKGVPREQTREAFVAAFVQLGYNVCSGGGFEEGYEKVALFEKNGVPSHAARMVTDGPDKGKWTSKMGRNIDIVHDLQAVSGRFYGAISVYLRRPMITRRP